MDKRIWLLGAGAALLLAIPAALAATKSVSATPETAFRLGDGKTAVVVDQERGVIRFLIEGQEKAFLDAGGLRVNGDVTYTGTIKDSGAAQTAKEGKNAP